MSGPGFRLSNVIGAPFRDYVFKQFETRVARGITNKRTNTEVLYLANKAAWVKLSSSTNLSPEYARKLSQYYTTADGFSESAVLDGGLARTWILQGGTSKAQVDVGAVTEAILTRTPQQNYDTGGTDLRSGLGFDGAYGLGGVEAQGYRPMPGLESVTVESAGKLGSLRYATINFKVWNMNQLDVIDALYFRLGYVMLLEWGHVNYYTNDIKPDSEAPGEYTTSDGGILGFFDDKVSKEKIIYDINSKIIQSDGNYDGMLGVVTNFNYSFNQEGGWDCSLKLLGIGSIMESQKINSSYTLPGWSKKVWDEYVGLVKQLVIARRQAELNERYEQEKRFAQITNAGIQQDFENTTGYKSLEDFFVRGLSNTAAPLNLDNNDQVKQLWSNTVITPYDINNVRAGNGGKDVQTINASYVQGTYGKSESGYVDKNGTLYVPAIQGTAGSFGAATGWHYPVTPGQRYTLDLARLGKIIRNGRVHAIDSNIGLTIDFKRRDFVSVNADYPESTDFSQPLQKQLSPFLGDLIKAADPLVAGLYDLTTLPTDLTEWYIYPQAQDIEINYGAGRGIYMDIEPTYGPISTYYQTWILNPVVEIDRASLTTAKYVTEAEWFAAMQNLGLDDPSRQWTLENVSVEEFLAEDAIGLDTPYTVTGLKGLAGAINSKAFPKQAFITLSTDVSFEIPTYAIGSGQTTTVNNLPVKESTTKLNGKVKIYTNYYSILKDVVDLAGAPTAPTGLVEEPKKELAELSAAEVKQIEKVDGMSSALEAMLSIVQYEGIVNAGGKGTVAVSKNELKSFSIRESVADLLKALPGAPLKSIFDANGQIKTGATLEPIPSNPESYYTDPYYLGLKGYSTALLSLQRDKDYKADLYNEFKTVDFNKLFTAYVLKKEYIATSVGSDDTLAVLETPVYIKLGFLLFFINNMCLLYDSTKKTDKTGARPHFYIDFNPDTNLCLTMPAHLTTDPRVCLIPYKGDVKNYEDLFKSIEKDPPTGYYKINAATTNTSKIVTDFKGTGGDHQAYTMEILVNTQYLLDTIRESVNRDNHNDVYFRPFMDRLLADINKALGDVNAFRLGYIDSGNVAAILDDQFVPPHPKEQVDNLLQPKRTATGKTVLPLFGQPSIARDLSFETNISTKMSSMIAIAARGNYNSGSTQSSDASNLAWLSEGLTDRVIQEANDVSQLKNAKASKVGSTNTTTNNPKNTVRDLSTVFDGHVRSIYGTGVEDYYIDKGAMEPSRNFYIQALTKNKAIDKITRGAPIIPLNLNFTTDGIAGINMGNVFLVPNEMLPISLRGDYIGDSLGYKFGYMVMGLSRNIQNNQWTTSIRGQIIKLRPDEDQLTIVQPQRAGSEGAVGNPPKLPTQASTTEQRNRRTTVDQLIMHYTAGWGGEPEETLDTLGTNGASIHYVIDRSGNIIGLEAASNIGVNRSSIRTPTRNANTMRTLDQDGGHAPGAQKNSVGVEVQNLGGVNQIGAGQYSFRGIKLNSDRVKFRWEIEPASSKRKGKSLNDTIIDLGFNWEGSNYHQDYTTEQYRAMEDLMIHVLEECPKIPIQYAKNHANMTDDQIKLEICQLVFGLEVNEYPLPNRVIKSRKVTNYDTNNPKWGQVTRKAGIYLHVAAGTSSHSDGPPTPEYLDMLVRLRRKFPNR